MKKHLHRLAVIVTCLGAILLLAALVAASTSPARAAPLEPLASVDRLAEVRQCGEPVRELDGTIKRSAAVLYAFRKLHPCPANGQRFAACPGWAINHVIPLAAGGCDAVSNLQWLPAEVKSCGHPWCVDRWERIYWGQPHGLVRFGQADQADQPPNPGASSAGN